MLEIEIIYFYDEHLALILIHDEIFVKIVDTFQIIQRHLLLIITAALLDILHEVRNGRTEIYHQFRHLHHFHHRLEKLHISLVVALVHVAHLPVVGRKDINTFKDGAVLDDRLFTVLDFQQILESLLQIEHLHIECPSRDILVIVIDIGVFCNGLQVLFPSIMFRKHLGECCLSTTDISCYCYIHLLIRIIYNLIMNNGAGAALAAKVQ